MLLTSRRRLAGLLIVAATTVSLGAAAHAQGGVIARVSGVTGLLEASASDAGPWTPLAKGSQLSDRQHLRTGAQSRAEIDFEGGEELVMGPESQVILRVREARSSLSRLVSVWLSQGVAEALFGEPNGGSFRVETDLVIAAARSTRWIVSRDQGQAEVFVEEGHVGVDPAEAVAGESVVLAPGEGVEVTEGDGLSAVGQWGEDRVQALRARLQPQ